MQGLKRNVAIVALWSSSGSRAHVRWATVSYHLNSSLLLDMIQNISRSILRRINCGT